MNFLQTLEIIRYKTYTDILHEARRSYLGILWWLIEPLLYLAAFYILFVLVLDRSEKNFVPFFLCGAVAWKWFDSCVKGGAQAISSNRGLLQQVYLPKYIFAVIAVLGSSARFLPVFGVFCVFLLLYGIPLKATWLAAPVLMFVQFLLGLSIALLVSAITPFLPDLRVAIDQGMMMLFFISGVFFNINEVHEPIRSYLLLNPMAGLIDEYRNILIRGMWPNMGRLAMISLVSLLIGVTGLALLKQLDHKYGKVHFS